MHTPRLEHASTIRGLALSLTLVAAGAAAQTTGSADHPRAAFRQELAPLALSIKAQVQAVTTELGRRLAAELANNLGIGAPRSQRPQLRPRETAGADTDRS